MRVGTRLMWIGLLAAVVSTSPATGLDDAQMARQCPGMAAWVKAREAEAMARRKAHPPAEPTEPGLRDELLKMSDADQKARNAVIADGGHDPAAIKIMLAVDARNLPRIKAIDARQGFPTLAQVGSDGVGAAWLLVQHADRDHAFQAHVLGELKPRLHEGGISAQDYALLTDRVLVAQHKPQRYGTQFKIIHGRMHVDPIEDAADVDKRRAAIGLPSLADYRCVLGMVYRMPAKP